MCAYICFCIYITYMYICMYVCMYIVYIYYIDIYLYELCNDISRNNNSTRGEYSNFLVKVAVKFFFLYMSYWD